MDDPVLAFKRVAGALVLLPIALLLAALLGQLMRRWWPRLGGFLTIFGLLAALAVCTPIVSRALIGWVEAASPPALSPVWIRSLMAESSPPRAIVILGGGSRFDARERPDTTVLKGDTLERVAAGARLARETGLPVLVSGGSGPGAREAEAVTMARVLTRDFGVTPRWIESRSRDTAGNARESAALLAEARIGRVLLVTQAYHMPRAIYAFEGAGLHVVAAPHGFLAGRGTPQAWVPGIQSIHASYLASHEAVGLWWYQLVRLARGESAVRPRVPVAGPKNGPRPGAVPKGGEPRNGPPKGGVTEVAPGK